MSEPLTTPVNRGALRIAIWMAIGALIAAALLCVVWVLVGDAAGIFGRALLTIMLLAGFAGIAVLEARLAPRRPAWFALSSMVAWVVILLVGTILIWLPQPLWYGWGGGTDRFVRFLLVVLVIQLAVLHSRLYVRAHLRYETTFTSTVAYVTLALVGILAVMLVVPLIVVEFVDFLSIYWRVVVAFAILAAVGTALIPLVNALFAPRSVATGGRSLGFGAMTGHPGDAPYGTPPTWPTYVDGRTPLPVLPDGSPDWNAYYTGRPMFPAAPVPEAGAGGVPGAGAVPGGGAVPGAGHSGYEGYPPPPPLPPTGR